MRVMARLQADLVAYREHVRTPLGRSPWLFLTKGRNFIKPSVSKIMALTQSRRYRIISI